MQIVERHAYQALDRVTNPDGTRYYVAEGQRLPSVTTILSATGDKTALNEWKARVGEKEAERQRLEATNLGTLMHENLEAHIQGRERPRGNNLVRVQARNMADVIIKQGLGDVGEVWGVEVALYYPGLYAGTTDLVGLYRGRPAIMDFKTAKKMKSREQIPDYMGQLCAYALAHDEVYGTEIDLGVVFMVSRDLSYRAFILEGEEFKQSKMDFLNRLETYMEAAP